MIDSVVDSVVGSVVDSVVGVWGETIPWLLEQELPILKFERAV